MISYSELKEMEVNVTILILIDGFLQCDLPDDIAEEISHNPYFNRWFSAIIDEKTNIVDDTLSQSLF